MREAPQQVHPALLGEQLALLVVLGVQGGMAISGRHATSAGSVSVQQGRMYEYLLRLAVCEIRLCCRAARADRPLLPGHPRRADLARTARGLPMGRDRGRRGAAGETNTIFRATHGPRVTMATRRRNHGNETP